MVLKWCGIWSPSSATDEDSGLLGCCVILASKYSLIETLLRLPDHEVKAAHFSEMLVTICLSTQHKIQNDLNPLLKGCLKPNLKCNESYEHVI